MTNIRGIVHIPMTITVRPVNGAPVQTDIVAQMDTTLDLARGTSTLTGRNRAITVLTHMVGASEVKSESRISLKMVLPGGKRGPIPITMVYMMGTVIWCSISQYHQTG